MTPVTGAGDAEGIGFLEGIGTDELREDLAGEGDDRDGIHHGVHEAGGEVGGAGSERGDAHPGRAGELPGGVGHEARAALVPHEHEVHALLRERRDQRGQQPPSEWVQHACRNRLARETVRWVKF